MQRCRARVQLPPGPSVQHCQAVLHLVRAMERFGGLQQSCKSIQLCTLFGLIIQAAQLRLMSILPSTMRPLISSIIPTGLFSPTIRPCRQRLHQPIQVVQSRLELLLNRRKLALSIPRGDTILLPLIRMASHMLFILATIIHKRCITQPMPTVHGLRLCSRIRMV